MNQKNYLITRRPKDNFLKNHIAYYYFHVSNYEEHSEAFYFYPNYMHALTIYKGNDVEIDLDGKSSKVRTSADTDKLTFLYCINLKDKIHVDLQGTYHKIGIVFYPLGINHFIDKPLNEFLSNSFQKLIMDTIFEEHIRTLKKEQPLEEQVEILESALIAVMRPFENKVLQRAVREIILSNGTIKVDALEAITFTARKTLLRLFKKHLYATIEDYKKMVMFRNSINYALQHQEMLNLTDIALYSMYYDQSHFIRHFKSITEETPKTLLPKIVQIGNEDLYWHFIDEK